MTEYICDTAKECGSATCNYRLSLPEHERLMPQLGFMCYKAGHRVYPKLVDSQPCYHHKLRGQESCPACAGETHACYYCNHEGTDVNRIDRLAINAVGDDEHIYCCDDAVACDHRWQEG